jgi:hypothetical protein
MMDLLLCNVRAPGRARGIQARRRRRLLELQQLFLDMAALVEAQGAPLDNIERHVATAASDVGAAEAELTEARRLQGEGGAAEAGLPGRRHRGAAARRLRRSRRGGARAGAQVSMPLGRVWINPLLLIPKSKSLLSTSYPPQSHTYPMDN